MLILLCFIIVFLSLNTISATDNNTNILPSIHKVSEDSITENIIIKEATNDVYVDINSNNELEDGSIDSPYKTINQEYMDKISSDSTIILAKGTYNLDSITLNKNMTITGENRDEVIIIPNLSSSMFTIEKNSTVTLKNFTLKDFTSDSNAAITNNGNLIIENMTLLNNVGTTTANMGGSILNNGNLEINNTLFEKNTASFGAAVYSKANVTVYNSSFIDNNIYNVGGAIYSTSGNLTVYDSYFTLNRAVSGAAIYNAFGNLYVNNTDFIENSAEHFFGGAIYSTGFATTTNCLFNYNYAKKDGGAITNTNNFTIINCSFIENAAGENGGVIENIPWTDKENGNLTIINSTFTGNGATYGGVFINYGKKEAVGLPGVITVRNTLFELNSAYIGGVVYNEQYIDFEDCVFIDNEAEEGNVISSEKELVLSVNNNWWGKNNISEEEIGFMPETWRILTFTNTSSLINNNNVSLEVSLNTLNDGNKTNNDLPERTVLFIADESLFAEDNMTINVTANNIVQYMGDEIFAQVDNQLLSLEEDRIKDTCIKFDETSNVKFKENGLISGILEDEKGKALSNKIIKLLINKGRATVKTDENGKFTYDYNFNRIGTTNITATFHGDEKYNKTSNTTSVLVEAQETKIILDNISPIKSGENITLTGKLVDINDNIIANNTIKLLINNGRATVKTDNEGVFTYNYKLTRVGQNNISVNYLGSNKYLASANRITVDVGKLESNLSLKSINATKKGNDITITGQLVDEQGKDIVGTVKLLINNGRATVKTDNNGVFTYIYTVNRVGINNITATYLGSNKYMNSTDMITVEVLKLNTKISIDPINKVTQKTKVEITGKLSDERGNAIYGKVKLLINTGHTTVKTDDNGFFTYNYTATHLGVNNITATYIESNNYLGSNSTCNFIVESNNK